LNLADGDDGDVFVNTVDLDNADILKEDCILSESHNTFDLNNNYNNNNMNLTLRMDKKQELDCISITSDDSLNNTRKFLQSGSGI